MRQQFGENFESLGYIKIIFLKIGKKNLFSHALVRILDFVEIKKSCLTCEWSERHVNLF